MPVLFILTEFVALFNRSLTHLIISFYPSVNFQDGLSNSFWMGGEDKLRNGNWTWQDGKPLDYTGYDNWNPGQPEPVDTGQHCLLRNKDSYKWHDNECDHVYKSVCEKP